MYLGLSPCLSEYCSPSQQHINGFVMTQSVIPISKCLRITTREDYSERSDHGHVFKNHFTDIATYLWPAKKVS